MRQKLITDVRLEHREPGGFDRFLDGFVDWAWRSVGIVAIAALLALLISVWLAPMG